MASILGMNLRDWRLKLLLLSVVVCLINLTSADDYKQAETQPSPYQLEDALIDNYKGVRGRISELQNRLLQAIDDEATPTETADPEHTGTDTGDEHGTKKHQTWFQKTVEGLGYSFFFIFLSELGDKTFLFVVLYATRMNGMKLLLISSIGLCGMHVAAVFFGGLFQYILSPFWLKLITVVSFFIMGVALLYMGITEEPDTEEFDEKMREIEIEMIEGRSRKLSHDNSGEEAHDGLLEAQNTQGNTSNDNPIVKFFKFLVKNEAIRIIVTIICTEMADRSQISAIALAANYDFWIVALAGSFGHILALILAILFGKAVSEHTSEKCINIVGGILFLAFSAYSIFMYYILEQD